MTPFIMLTLISILIFIVTGLVFIIIVNLIPKDKCFKSLRNMAYSVGLMVFGLQIILYLVQSGFLPVFTDTWDANVDDKPAQVIGPSQAVPSPVKVVRDEEKTKEAIKENKDRLKKFQDSFKN